MNYKGITPEQLLDYLADNEICDGVQPVEGEDGLMHIQVDEPSKTDHPVMIGDVLNKLYVPEIICIQDTLEIDILYKWSKCGFNKSLNDILSDEIILRDRREGFSEELRMLNGYEFDDINTQALFKFLVDTFKDKIK